MYVILRADLLFDENTLSLNNANSTKGRKMNRAMIRLRRNTHADDKKKL